MKITVHHWRYYAPNPYHGRITHAGTLEINGSFNKAKRTKRMMAAVMPKVTFGRIKSGPAY